MAMGDTYSFGGPGRQAVAQSMMAAGQGIQQPQATPNRLWAGRGGAQQAMPLPTEGPLSGGLQGLGAALQQHRLMPFNSSANVGGFR